MGDPQHVTARVTRSPLAALRSALAGLDPRVPWVSAAFFLFLGARLSVLTFVSIYFVREQGLPAAIVGAAFLAENVLRALAAPLAGSLSDRFGRTPLLAGSAIGAAIVMPTFLLIRDVPTLFIWSLAIGLVQAPFFPVGTALLLDLVPPAIRQRALALNYSVISVGYTVAVAPAGFIAERGFAALGLLSGGLFALTAAIVLLRLRGAPSDVVVHAADGPGLFARTVQAFRDGPFIALALFAFAFPLGIGLISLAFPLYAADSGVPASEIGLALAGSGLIVAVLAVPANTLLERRGPFRSLPIASVFVAASYAALVAAGSSFTGLLLAVSVFTLGEIVFAAALPTAVAALAPAGARGSYQGAWGMVTALSIGSALFLAGIGRASVGWAATWLAFAALTAAAGLGLYLVRRPLTRIATERAALGQGSTGIDDGPRGDLRIARGHDANDGQVEALGKARE